MTDTDNSIIDAQYREKYKTPDWLGDFVNANAVDAVTKEVEVKDEEGNVTGTETKTTGKTVLDLDKFFDLCEKNHVNTDKMRAQRDGKNAAGRIRMTLGNSLRAAARRRGGLFDLDGEWNEAPEEITKGKEPVENADGTKIAKAKTDETEDA